jgi:hypothetical protein
MPTFHVILQALGDWPCSFEEAVAALEALPRMFIELDGSFVWRSPDEAQPWQLDGCLFDRAGRLQYVELKGTCSRARFAEFLACLNAHSTELNVQLVREAESIPLADFEQRLEA